MRKTDMEERVKQRRRRERETEKGREAEKRREGGGQRDERRREGEEEGWRDEGREKRRDGGTERESRSTLSPARALGVSWPLAVTSWAEVCVRYAGRCTTGCRRSARSARRA